MKPDLQAEHNYILKSMKKHGSLKRVYKELRVKARYNSVGDYPLISFICSIAKEAGIKVQRKAAVETLRIAIDGEFKQIREDSQIVRQLCA